MRMLPLLALAALVACSRAGKGGDAGGPELFARHCAGCHAGGGNAVNRAKGLDPLTLRANGIDNEKKIVEILRRPGPGMPVFDRSRISDADALTLGRYVLRTFGH